MKKCAFIAIITLVSIVNASKHKPDMAPPCIAGSGGYVNYSSLC
jgi:hypothetical protein